MKELEQKPKDEGRYVYCIADSEKSINFGRIGIDNSEVYTIPFKGLCAVVHNCKAEPYKSDDEVVVKNWIRQHDGVIDKASELGTVIPLTFDMIIKGSNKEVMNWLEKENGRLRDIIKRIEGKQEFGVQVFLDRKIMGSKIAEENKEIQGLRREMKKESKGKAYFLKQKIEKILKMEIEKRADLYFKDFFNRIKRFADDVRVGRVKNSDMLMNLSCLVRKDNVEDLGTELGIINNINGFSVRFTGPWPPYSFV
ncbi:MAG: GvpL/GvpF family gas vesicle protein [Nanoarchaeota archaeon]